MTMKPHYLCLKSSKVYQCKKGKVYVLDNSGSGDELVNYNRRWQNRLLNADLMLAQPGLFEPIDTIRTPLRPDECDCDECREGRK